MFRCVARNVILNVRVEDANVLLSDFLGALSLEAGTFKYA